MRFALERKRGYDDVDYRNACVTGIKISRKPAAVERYEAILALKISISCSEDLSPIERKEIESGIRKTSNLLGLARKGLIR